MIGRLTTPTSASTEPARAPRPRIVERVHQRDIAEIEKEQHQHRGQPRVPHPPRAPHRPAPQRAGREAHEREGGADRRRRLRRDLGQRMAPHQRDRARDRDEQIDRQRHPRRRHMDEHDPHALALLVIGRRRRPATSTRPTASVTAVTAPSQGSTAPLSAHEARRVGKAGQHCGAYLLRDGLQFSVTRILCRNPPHRSRASGAGTQVPIVCERLNRAPGATPAAVGERRQRQRRQAHRAEQQQMGRPPSPVRLASTAPVPKISGGR